MSFREKSAWVTLIALLIVSLLYWAHVPKLIEPERGIWIMHALAASTVAFIVIELVGHFVLRWRNPEEAREPVDERERMIDLKAIRLAYYTFVVCALMGIFVAMHLIRTGPGAVGTTIMIALVIAEIVRQIARIVFYRRGV